MLFFFLRKVEKKKNQKIFFLKKKKILKGSCLEVASPGAFGKELLLNL